MKITTGKTHRGFELGQFKDLYGKSCSIQKSSLATDDAIWFGINDAEPRIMASHAEALGVDTDKTTGWIPYPLHKDVSLNTRMHLNREQVAALLPTLQRFAETGEI